MKDGKIFALGALALLTGGCGHGLGSTGGAPTTTTSPASPVTTPAATPTAPPSASAFSPPGGGFSVNPPVTPTESLKMIPTAAGTIPTHMFTSEVDGNDVYMVVYGDYPPQIKSASPDKVLEGACHGAATNLGGTVDNEQTISLNGNPGRDFTSTSAKGTVHARVYLDGVRLYQVLAVHTAGSTNASQDTAFLNSFQLTQ